jgi:hypothetical protein
MNLDRLPEDDLPAAQVDGISPAVEEDGNPRAVPVDDNSRATPVDDNPSAAQVVRFEPSKAWLERFAAECTEDLLKRARYFAAQRAQDLGWQMAGPGVYDPDELVDNIVTETLAGRISWNPEKQRFDQYLYDAVRVRVLRHAQRAWQYPHESIDAEDLEGESQTMAEVEEKLLAISPDATIDTAERVADTIYVLRELAVRKPLVQRLLTAFECGKFSKEEIVESGHLTSAEYHNARRQLTRLFDRLPSHLKPWARGLAKGA